MTIICKKDKIVLGNKNNNINFAVPYGGKEMVR
jgi:hypothetical protein